MRGLDALVCESPTSSLVELVGMRGEPWRRDAACLEHRDDVDWFPTVGADPRPAKRVCAACLVRRECLAYALGLSGYELHGVWGGTTRTERRALRRRFPDSLPAVLPPVHIVELEEKRQQMARARTAHA